MSHPTAGISPALFDPSAPEQALLAAGSVAGLFFQRARALGDQPFLLQSHADGWRGWSWREAAGRVAGVAQALARHGVKRGDRVLLVSENRIEWHASDLSILAAGAVTVPLPSTASVDDWRYIITHAEPSAVIVSQRLVAKFEQAAPAGRPLFRLTIGSDHDEFSWEQPAAAGGPEPVQFAGLDDLCCLIYTSGSGGTPKGVEQTQRNLLSNVAAAIRNLRPYGLEGHRIFSFLPLSHTFEHTAGFVTPIALGAQLFVSRGPEHFAQELPAAAPTLMCVVPRFCEVMHQRIQTELRRQSRLAQSLFARTEAIGRRRVRREPVSLVDAAWDATLGRVVRGRLRAKFGGALRCMLSAGAPLRPETSEFFNGLGLPLHEAYGMTEAAPGITMQRHGQIRPGTVGPPMHGVEVRLAGDGEILARGPNVMRGYWRDPAATAAALADGWLHTGDIGRFDADGSLVIVDRKKDFLKTAGADMVAPQPIELALTKEPGIAQAMLCGDGWPHLAALLVPDPETREALTAGKLPPRELETRMQAAVDRVNAGLAPTRRIRRFAVLAEPFTPDNGLLTSTLKIRRRAVLERHAAIIAGLRHA
ncbi:MAG: long-chain fatty acid--CoA ligase [Verrucomicrobia bacterium]|nr:long-chain fatty acid--CoA ligase [Verrucomicrobiota bacterium]